MKIVIFMILLSITVPAKADPFIVSNAFTGATMPTHCYLYVDGSPTPTKSGVSISGTGTVTCRADVGTLDVGTHTLQISGALESGGVLLYESSIVTINNLIKENCSDASVCIYKYQFGDTIIWYK